MAAGSIFGILSVLFFSEEFMRYKGGCLHVRRSHHFKLKVLILSMCPALFLFGACKKEEPREVRAPKVVMRIKVPVEKKALLQGDATTGQSSPKTSKGTGTAALKKISRTPEKPEAGRYKTRKGDSLFKISGMPEIYGNSLKWPSLFRLNMDQLGGMQVTDTFEHKGLPKGIKIRFVTPEEAKKNLAQVYRKPWVVNVLSSQSSKEIVPAAVLLMKKGYRVYITKTVIKGKGWMRLRAGYYKNRKKAVAAGKVIKTIMNASDAWVAAIGKEERESTGGY